MNSKVVVAKRKGRENGKLLLVDYKFAFVIIINLGLMYNMVIIAKNTILNT